MKKITERQLANLKTGGRAGKYGCIAKVVDSNGQFLTIDPSKQAHIEPADIGAYDYLQMLSEETRARYVEIDKKFPR